VEDARESAAKPDNVVIPKPPLEQAEGPVSERKKTPTTYCHDDLWGIPEGLEIYRPFSPGYPVDEILGHHRRLIDELIRENIKRTNISAI
jgi:hypothetical protein